jgi:hypothetical protein
VLYSKELLVWDLHFLDPLDRSDCCVTKFMVRDAWIQVGRPFANAKASRELVAAVPGPRQAWLTRYSGPKRF